jgi:hypothetical protein
MDSIDEALKSRAQKLEAEQAAALAELGESLVGRLISLFMPNT